jgi:signal transduction histidine kinase
MADERLRVLIVEDAPITAEAMRRMLAAEPDLVVVGVAATGAEGVAYTRELCPDVVLMDVHLPGIDGLEATERIVAENSDVSVILVTSEERIEFLQQAMLCGAQGYLLKPINDASEVAGTVRTVRQRALERRALLSVVRQAHALEQRQEQFLALISHELRQPVAAIALTAEALGGAAGLGPVEQQALGVLGRQARRLAQLADDLLLVARLETQQFALHPTLVDLCALVGALTRENLASERLRVTAPPGRVLVEADPERLGQVVDNLIDNALKYSGPTDLVEVEVRGSATEATVAVRDHGIGLTADEIPHLFQKYGRLEHAREAHVDGVGLGLYLSRLLMAAHDGTITVTSAGRGRGSRFAVCLPRVEAEPRERTRPGDA